MDLISTFVRIVLNRTSSSVFTTVLLLSLWIASLNVFSALLLSYGCEKQPGIGQAPLALVQVMQQPRIGSSVGLSALLSSKPKKALGLRAQASFQLICSYPVVKTTRDRS
jgi:hypothetical protein